MKTLHPAIWLLFAPLLGCAVLPGASRGSRAPGEVSPAPSGWLDRSQIDVGRDGLSFAAQLHAVPKDAVLAVSLVGPDGKEQELVRRKGLKAGSSGPLEGWWPDRKARGRQKLDDEMLASLFEDMGGAGDYTITLSADGSELDAATFDLIEVPKLGGGSRLTVAPPEPSVAFLGRGALRYVRTQSIAEQARPMSVFEFVDGVLLGEAKRKFSKPIGFARSAASLSNMPLASTVAYSFGVNQQTTGAHEVVLVADDSQVLGSVRYAVQGGKLVDRGQPRAELKKPSPAAMARVREALSNARPTESRPPRLWTEQVYCAVAELDEARKPAESLIRSGRSVVGTRELEHDIEFGNRKERSAAKKSKRARTKRNLSAMDRYASAEERLKRLGSAYGPGCLDALLPSGLRSPPSAAVDKS